MSSAAPGPEVAERAVRTTQVMGLGMMLAGLAMVIPAWFLRMEMGLRPLQIAAAALGLIAPAAGYHLFMAQKKKLDAEAELDGDGRVARFVQAFTLAGALSEGGALLACVAFALTSQPLTLIGVATHVLIMGALWPSAERVQWFVEPGPGA